jgi:predicted MPP superfamily phosphohydrolase
MHTRTHLSPSASVKQARWLARRELLEANPVLRSSPDGVRLRLTMPLVHACIDAFALAMRLSGLHARGVANTLSVDLRELEFAFSDLPPAFDGYTILHLTDPHFDAHPALADSILAAVEGQSVDLMAMTGDYVVADSGSPEPSAAPLARLLAAVTARDGVVATLGNHDTAAAVPMMQALGVRVLIDESVAIERGDQALVLTGTDDVHRYWSPDATAAIQAFAPSAGRFGIALVHSPELAPEAAAAGHSLYLCGHTHAGQIALPGGIPILTHDQRRHGQVPRRLAQGCWHYGAMAGVTSAGAGVSCAPLRYGTRAEVLRITLRRGI